MLTLKFRETSNWRTLVKVEKKVIDGVEKGTEATVAAIIDHIQQSWSATQQTVRSGNPPALDSTNLSTSIFMETQGRDEAGRFAGKDAKVRYIRVNTLDGQYPNGYNYAMALEDPDYYDLPFLAPALDKIGGTYTSNIKRFMRI